MLVALSGAAACTLDIPPSVPEVTSGGTLVVPDRGSDQLRELDGYGSEPIRDCESACPRRDRMHVETCHPAAVEPRVARHRAHLGERVDSYVLCYYEVD